MNSETHNIIVFNNKIISLYTELKVIDKLSQNNMDRLKNKVLIIEDFMVSSISQCSHRNKIAMKVPSTKST
jgi:hypothetical protein